MGRKEEEAVFDAIKQYNREQGKEEEEKEELAVTLSHFWRVA